MELACTNVTCVGVELSSLLRGDGKALPSLGAATLQDQAAVLGTHAHQETVGAGPALAIRLERTLHDV